MTIPYVSIHGKAVGYDAGGLIVLGRRVGEVRGFGKDFYVDSVTGDANADGSNPDNAVATIKQAFALARANKGDRIIVLPGHAESIASATGLTANKAGVRVIALGEGLGAATLTFSTANTATIAVSADGITFENFNIVANFLSIAAAFTLTTAKGFKLIGNRIRETSGVLNFLNIIKSTGAANTVDGLVALDNTWNGLGTTSVNSFALIADAVDRVVMRGNRVILERTADAAILLTQTTGACTNGEFGDNVVVSKQTAVTNGGTLLNVGASSTGVVYRNFSGTLVTSGDKLFTTTVGLFPFENRVSGVVGATGFVIPAVDS